MNAVISPDRTPTTTYGDTAMTMTSPAHAMAYAHISDLLRTAAQQRRLDRGGRRRFSRTPASARPSMQATMVAPRT